MEYINKKWDLPTMEKRIENLKKIISPGVVDWIVRYNLNRTDSRLDGLYLAYYELKDRYCKINRRAFGQPKKVKFEPKKRDTIWYSNDTNIWYDSYYGSYNGSSVTYTLSNATATTTAATINWNPNDYLWDVLTERN